MGYLNNQVVEVDAILTRRGRELLARGAQYFNISQFALADDEVDYRLWNPDHSLGSNYYGEVIESMPILEAVPDERQMMKSKLVTLPKTITRLPIITSGITGAQTLRSGESLAIVPGTPNYQNGNGVFGYTCVVSDGDVAALSVTRQIANTNLPTTPVYLGDGVGSSISAMGLEFRITGKLQLSRDRQVTVTIVGNETGGRTSFVVTVKKAELTTIDTTSNTFLANNQAR